jgi:hypothetical protein
MEQVDDIIILSLREIGCDVNEGIKSLSSFSPELCVSSVSKIIKIINPQIEVPSNLPPGMAQRFQVTTQLAEACTVSFPHNFNQKSNKSSFQKILNYKGDLGYQTFLYSNVLELRRLFMWLIERLPKEERETVQKTTTDKTKLIENEITKSLLHELKKPWLFEFQENRGSRKFLPVDLQIADSFGSDNDALLEYKRKYEPAIYQQAASKDGNILLASIIQNNDNQLLGDNYDYLGKLKDLKYKTASSSFEISLMSSPKKMASEKLEVQEGAAAQPAPRKLSESEILEEEIEELKSQIEIEETQQKGLLIEQEQIQEKLSDIVIDLEKLKNEKRVVERTAMLLDDPEDNEKKLREMIEVSKRKIQSLHEQWDQHKRPLEEQIRENESVSQKVSKIARSIGLFFFTKLILLFQSKISEILAEIKTTKQKTQTIVEDIKFKTKLHQELLTELQTANKNVQRISYTSRIIDIIGSIKKQNNDIDKILGDTRELQKSIARLQEQLNRQYKVSDDLLFQVNLFIGFFEFLIKVGSFFPLQIECQEG